MKNSSNLLQTLLNSGIVGVISNKKIKKSKRYTMLIFCIIFYLILIGLCVYGSILNFNNNVTLFIILGILGIILLIDFIRFIYNVIFNLKTR